MKIAGFPGPFRSGLEFPRTLWLGQAAVQEYLVVPYSQALLFYVEANSMSACIIRILNQFAGHGIEALKSGQDLTNIAKQWCDVRNINRIFLIGGHRSFAC